MPQTNLMLTMLSTARPAGKSSQVWDAAGLLYRRDLHAEAGLSDPLVRVRWGGARHNDRYRWATWSGRLTVAGSSIDDVTPWAATHPEQVFTP